MHPVGKTCIIYTIQHEKSYGNKDNASKITLIMTQSEQFMQKTYYITGEICISKQVQGTIHKTLIKVGSEAS